MTAVLLHRPIPEISRQRSAKEALAQKEWLSRKEAAQYLTLSGFSIAPQTLANLAANKNSGRGPAFESSGWKAVRYRPADLDAWAAARTKRIE